MESEKRKCIDYSKHKNRVRLLSHL